MSGARGAISGAKDAASNAKGAMSGTASLAGEPLLAKLAPLFLGGASPDTGLLVRGKRELQAGVLCWAGHAHCLCRSDLLQGRSGGADREEKVRIGVTARRAVTPVVAVPFYGAVPHQGHVASPPSLFVCLSIGITYLCFLLLAFTTNLNREVKRPVAPILVIYFTSDATEALAY